MKITFYGHACLGIEIKGIAILVDPFITGNPKASHIDINEIKADYILLTHAHQDHTLDVETIAKRTNAVIVSNFEIASYYGNKGFKNHTMNHGGSWNFDFGKLKYVIALHTRITSYNVCYTKLLRIGYSDSRSLLSVDVYISSSNG